jgi:8-oxo-dGTP pyrophosphatase MutT (NUDIX family)
MMELQDLRQAISTYSPSDVDEQAMQAQLLNFMDSHVDCLWRTQLSGHITASAWVLDPVTQAVLLIHHRKLDKWLQPGGHADGEADTLAVAQREVLEETGLETDATSTGIFDLDIHAIPARGSEPAHYHYDLRYLLQPKPGSKIQINEEVHAAEWIPLQAIQQRTSERSILRMVEKCS